MSEGKREGALRVNKAVDREDGSSLSHSGHALRPIIDLNCQTATS